MWVFNIKVEEGSSRYKARLVAEGCTQRSGLDYSDTFAPVAKMTISGCDTKLIDTSNGCENSLFEWKFERGNFMKFPIDENGKSNFCKLNKSIYGLKQAGRSWNLKFNETITKL